MTSTYTSNLNLEEPARGDYVGTWDTPVNANMSVLDLTGGGISVLTLNNSNVTLSAAQFQCATLTFTSTLTGNVAITFPSTFKKAYNIYNLCTGSSAFTITLQTTTAGAVVCAPPGDCQIVNGGGPIVYLNLGRVGTYWDYAGSSVPAWVSGCTTPPYLNCDGSTFSATTYPQLAVILGSTTLPDARGRYRAALNQTTGRITSAVGGVDGNTVAAAGSSQSVTLTTSNLPAYTPSGTIVSSVFLIFQPVQSGAGISAYVPAASGSGSANTGVTATSVFSGVAQGGVSLPFGILPPTYMGGITMIRAG